MVEHDELHAPLWFLPLRSGPDKPRRRGFWFKPAKTMHLQYVDGKKRNLMSFVENSPSQDFFAKAEK